MWRQGLKRAVVLQVSIHIAVFPILVEHAPHEVFQMDSRVVVKVFLLNLLVGTNQPVRLRHTKRCVHFFNDAAIDGIFVNDVALLAFFVVEVLVVDENGVRRLRLLGSADDCTEILELSEVNVLQFKDKEFVPTGTDGAWWLNPDLRNYKRTFNNKKTADGYEQTDLMPDGTYRRTIWKGAKTLDDLRKKPDEVKIGKNKDFKE